MSREGLRASVGEATLHASAGPWRTACDVIDAPPRTFDLVLVIGLCFALLLARVTSALRDWRRR